jgi:predicted lactoylglutathione lyase
MSAECRSARLPDEPLVARSSEEGEDMMSKMIFVNLPVRDLAASTAFYVALGGTVNPQFSGENSSSLMFSDSIGVMLLTYDHYRMFTQRPIGDARRESQALIALSAESREAVNQTLDRAVAAGGIADPNPAQDHGFMFNRNVEDPDGYVWEIMWMDPAALAGTPGSA